MYVSHVCLLCGFDCRLCIVGSDSEEAANADCHEYKSDGSFHEFSRSPMIRPKMSFVLEIIDLPHQRHVILHHAFAPLTNVFRGAEVREEPEVVNQV